MDAKPYKIISFRVPHQQVKAAERLKVKFRKQTETHILGRSCSRQAVLEYALELGLRVLTGKEASK